MSGVDNTAKILDTLARMNSRGPIIQFSKKFGHKAVMHADINLAKDDAIICMDCYLQHLTSCINHI